MAEFEATGVNEAEVAEPSQEDTGVNEQESAETVSEEEVVEEEVQEAKLNRPAPKQKPHRENLRN